MEQVTPGTLITATTMSREADCPIDHTASSSGAVFKVLRGSEWQAFQSSGLFAGSPDDLRDGFIHLSTERQLTGTIARHFAGQTDLVIAGFDPAALGDLLRWEPSRNGELFPHHYGQLRLAEVRSVRHPT